MEGNISKAQYERICCEDALLQIPEKCEAASQQERRRINKKTDQGIDQIRSEQCSFSLEAESCPTMENSGRRNISFDPVPGQGVELLAGYKGSALGLLQAALAACLTVRRRAVPSESPLNNGILAIIPRGLYTALKKQQKDRGICRLPQQGKPEPEETKGGENDADLIFFPYKQ